MSSAAGSIFTGSSQFSNDFQQVISRAVSFASLPMQQMQSEVTALQSQSSELNTLDTRFGMLQTAIGTLSSALGTGSYTASSSATAVATASLSGTPSAGTYTVEVDSIGTNASAMSSDGLTTVTDPTQSGISDATSYTLSVGTSSFTINASDNTLSGLANAINLSSSGVEATVVNVGAEGTNDYRLSIRDTRMENVDIQLTSLDGSSPGTDLLSPQTDGAPTTYRVNGKPSADSDPLTTSIPSITLSPGVTVSLAGVGTATITVGRSTAGVSNALASFVGAYNAAQAEINSNRGQGKGALQGQSVLSALSGVLQQMANYSTGSSGISSLTSLGLSFDKTGVLSFDSSAFSAATKGQLAALTDFLGSTTSGGFLKSANDALTSLTDPISGLFQSNINTVQAAVTRENGAIADQQNRINTLNLSLNQQMAAADAAVASMEQQYSYMSEMYQQMQTNAQSGMF